MGLHNLERLKRNPGEAALVIFHFLRQQVLHLSMGVSHQGKKALPFEGERSLLGEVSKCQVKCLLVQSFPTFFHILTNTEVGLMEEAGQLWWECSGHPRPYLAILEGLSFSAGFSPSASAPLCLGSPVRKFLVIGPFLLKYEAFLH